MGSLVNLKGTESKTNHKAGVQGPKKKNINPKNLKFCHTDVVSHTLESVCAFYFQNLRCFGFEDFYKTKPGRKWEAWSSYVVCLLCTTLGPENPSANECLVESKYSRMSSNSANRRGQGPL